MSCTCQITDAEWPHQCDRCENNGLKIDSAGYPWVHPWVGAGQTAHTPTLDPRFANLLGASAEVSVVAGLAEANGPGTAWLQNDDGEQTITNTDCMDRGYLLIYAMGSTVTVTAPGVTAGVACINFLEVNGGTVYNTNPGVLAGINPGGNISGALLTMQQPTNNFFVWVRLSPGGTFTTKQRCYAAVTGPGVSIPGQQVALYFGSSVGVVGFDAKILAGV